MPKKERKGCTAALKPVETKNRFDTLEAEETIEVEMEQDKEEERELPVKTQTKNVSRNENMFTTKTREQKRNDALKIQAKKPIGN